MKFKLKKTCNVCGKNFHNQNSINLPKMPITEILLKSSKYKNKILYDQKLKYCESCHHIQLQNQYDTSSFYKQSYLYSSTNSYSGRYTNDMFYEFIYKNIDFSKKYKILEVGANDLYLIKKLKKIINVASTIDPCIKPDKKIKKVQYIKKFLEDTSRSEINFVPDIVICSHTFEHIEDPKKFIHMITKLGNDKTKYFFQFPSCESIIDRSAFDQIHHQHFNYFSINSFSKLLKKFKLGVKKYEICELHYGSLMVYFKKSQALKEIKNFEVLKSNKKLSQIYSEYKSYMESLIKIIKKYKKRGSKIYGIGAGLMLPLVNYHLKDILNDVDGILDDDKNKINKFYPKLKTKISSLKDTDLKDSVALICSTASSITTRKLAELCRLKSAKIIIIPSLTL
jgi:cyclopropane-fatty-acyl-phospholipid synthase